MKNKNSRKDLFACLFFIIAWLVPLVYTGLTNKDCPFMPRTLVYFQRIAMLFTHELYFWPLYYIQAQEEPDGPWVTLDEQDYFRLKPFGYRTRLHQFMTVSKDKTGFEKSEAEVYASRQELADWIAKRAEERSGQKFTGVRFVGALYRVRKDPPVEGRWQKPALEELPAGDTMVISSHKAR